MNYRRKAETKSISTQVSLSCSERVEIKLIFTRSVSRLLLFSNHNNQHYQKLSKVWVQWWRLFKRRFLLIQVSATVYNADANVESWRVNLVLTWTSAAFNTYVINALLPLLYLSSTISCKCVGQQDTEWERTTSRTASGRQTWWSAAKNSDTLGQHILYFDN